MGYDFNSIFCSGRLTDSPTPLGDNGVRFDLAINRRYKNKDGEPVEKTTYLPIKCWGPQSKHILKYCDKGSPVMVEGRVEIEKFEGDDGSMKKYFGVVAKNVSFLGGYKNDTNTTQEKTAENNMPSGIDETTYKALQALLNKK